MLCISPGTADVTKVYSSWLSSVHGSASADCWAAVDGSQGQYTLRHFCACLNIIVILQIDWAGLVIKELMNDNNVGQINMEDTPILEPRPSVLTDDVRDPFTELLMFYAEKSLQFPTMTGSQGSVCK